MSVHKIKIWADNIVVMKNFESDVGSKKLSIVEG